MKLENDELKLTEDLLSKEIYQRYYAMLEPKCEIDEQESIRDIEPLEDLLIKIRIQIWADDQIFAHIISNKGMLVRSDKDGYYLSSKGVDPQVRMSKVYKTKKEFINHLKSDRHGVFL